jgi:hypothetical protein
MSSQTKHTGIAIAIAWPETYCKQPGSWYDKLLPLVGINKFNYYQVGHAAVVLIDPQKLKCHYFDFGRYHTPFQHGRVRSVASDHDLEMKTMPKIAPNNKQLLNFDEILNELQNNTSCHGEGTLHASYSVINFEKALKMANKMQERGPIPYGPFLANGSNCSRFVCSVLNAGKPNWTMRLKLNFGIPLTPTPLSNVHAFGNQKTLPHPKNKLRHAPTCKLSPELIPQVLPQPARNKMIPKSTQWLSGEGAGSWFETRVINKQIMLNRYSPTGELECSVFFDNSSNTIDTLQKCTVTYPSNCKVLTLKSGKTKISLKRAS